jgi:hypothetical protein
MSKKAPARKTSKTVRARGPSTKPKATGKAAPARTGPARKAPVARRADYKQPGEVAIESMPEPQRSIARAADKAIRAGVPGTVSVVKWGNACYYRDDRAFAALVATRRGVNLVLPGTRLADPDKLLEGTGQTMRHIKLADTKLVKTPGVRKLIVAASKIGLDRM